jgi:hypothetical protein
VSLTKHASTTTPTNKIVITTWQDSPGVRHYALAGPAECGDDYLCDVFTPCAGYIWDVLDNCDDVGPVTCFECLVCGFMEEVGMMNLEAIEHLDESSLLEHLLDNDAMAPGFDD